MVTMVNVPRYIALLKNYSSKPVLTQWEGKDGEFVEEGQGIALIETNKASLEITATVSGILFILRSTGETVKIGDTIGIIADRKEAIEVLQTQLMAYLERPLEQSMGI